MRLSQPYKSPNISGADGEQTEERKEEEERGLRWLTQAPAVSKHKGKNGGWDSPLRAPIPHRQCSGLDGRWSGATGAKWGQK